MEGKRLTKRQFEATRKTRHAQQITDHPERIDYIKKLSNFLGICKKKKKMNLEKFELGRCYRHASGREMYICGVADTIMWGTSFIA